MGEYIVGANGYQSVRKYDSLITNMTLSSEWPPTDKNMEMPNTAVRVLVDVETGIFVAGVENFERWISGINGTLDTILRETEKSDEQG